MSEARTPQEVDSAFSRLVDQRVDVVVALYDALFFQERKHMAALALDAGVPTVYAARDHVSEGGLMSYGISLSASARRLALFIDKVFKGENPRDIPVEKARTCHQPSHRPHPPPNRAIHTACPRR